MIKENCSAGCPCNDFDCHAPTSVPTTTTTTTTTTIITTTTPISPTRNAVLVLSTFKSNNKPFIVDFNGKYFMLFSNFNFRCQGNINEDLNFEYGDNTGVHWGCGATLHNVFWYFGGSPDPRQVKLQKHLLDTYLFFSGK